MSGKNINKKDLLLEISVLKGAYRDLLGMIHQQGTYLNQVIKLLDANGLIPKEEKAVEYDAGKELLNQDEEA